MVKKQAFNKKCKIIKLEQFASFMIEMHLHQIQEMETQTDVDVEFKRVELNKPFKIVEENEETKMMGKIEALPKTNEERAVKNLFGALNKFSHEKSGGSAPNILELMMQMPMSPPPPPSMPIIMIMQMKEYEKMGRPTIGDTVTVTMVRE